MPTQFTNTNNSYRHYNLPIVFPCMAFLGDNWVLDDNSQRPHHFHNCIELGYCKSGSGTLVAENRTISFHAGNYSFLPENITHKAFAAPGTKSCWEYIYFDPYLLFQNVLPQEELDLLLYSLRNEVQVIDTKTNPAVHLHIGYIMEHIFSELHKKEPYYQDSLKGLFLSLLMLIGRNHRLPNDSTSDFQWLYTTIRYIRKHYYRKLSIAEISKNCCNLSESHFRKKFTQTMQISPLDYINHLRIRIACQAIYDNEKPINEIAANVGFSTLSSFNRNFQALLHCSPSEWRRQQRSYRDIPEITSMDDPRTQNLFLL